MESRLALVIVVDGLRASALGTYGNTSVSTNLFNELASRSLVVEWLVSTGPQLADFYGGALSALNLSGTCRWHITDDLAVMQALPTGLFDETVSIEQVASGSADDVSSTYSADFFSEAARQLSQWHQAAVERSAHGLLWVHFSGLSGPWDAPLPLRQELLEDDELAVPSFVMPPNESDNVTDPDTLLTYRAAYAAQVTVIEACLAGLIQEFKSLATDARKLVMVVGSRGYPLGEHGTVGLDSPSLYSEQLHLPWMVMTEESHTPLPRVTGLAQPPDIGATLSDWLTGATEPGETRAKSLFPFLGGLPGHMRDFAVATSGESGPLIRTPAWMMIQGDPPLLFVKPDDLWEANDVANLCPEIVEQLSGCLDAIRAGQMPSLSDELLSH